MSPSSVDISTIGKLSSYLVHLSLPSVSSLFSFSLFHYFSPFSLANVSVCPRAQYAFHLSSLCRRSTYTLCTLSTSPSASFLPITASPTTFFYLFTYFVHIALGFLVLRYNVSYCLSSSVSYSAERVRKRRVKIHGDFNTFNFFIIHFAPSGRNGNNDDTPLQFSLSFSFFSSFSSLLSRKTKL